ncbi:N-acetyltransferase [uncultured Rummeliibacillus sp.]|uniref:GNAT family N-acetyltransferase n=1 Tax=uncultured Rummeliibacillus sp. TaxID=762292 RepID=UPI002604E3C5|nr:GNAT family N-acetyltransferase [uncultured Rummeliibacillus sp.]
MKLLVKMNEAEFEKYIADKEKRYAETLASHTYEITESADIRAKKSMQQYLPNGFHTNQHEFYKIVYHNDDCGYVWIKIDDGKKSAFLYEIFIFDQYRSKGIGTMVMNEIQEYLTSKEIQYFKLHVFGTNVKAIKLYETLGFEVAGINMYKEI